MLIQPPLSATPEFFTKPAKQSCFVSYKTAQIFKLRNLSSRNQFFRKLCYGSAFTHEQEQSLTWLLYPRGYFVSPLPPLTRESASRSLPWIPLCGTLYLHGETCAASPHPTTATFRCISSLTFPAIELICFSSFLIHAMCAIDFTPLIFSPPLELIIL